ALIMLLFPTSFFFVAVYTESVFLLLALGACMLLEQKCWLWVAFTLMLASATRIVGVVLTPAMLIGLLSQQVAAGASLRVTPKKAIVAVLSGALGLLSYMLYLWREFGDPLYFFSVQSDFGGDRQESLVLLPQVIWRYMKMLATADPTRFSYYAAVQEFVINMLVFFILIMATGVFLQKLLVSRVSGLLSRVLAVFDTRLLSQLYVPSSWLVYSWGVFLIPTLTGTFSSMPRYVIVIFPLYVWIAQLLSGKHSLLLLLFLISAIVLFINVVLFTQGYWVA
ncbi:hypothetical protein KC686_04095, partial [Candidatus Woesebacteria bacterium]|nr:hypothetical protein [Candidatus Woesebacteria bacterium]